MAFEKYEPTRSEELKNPEAKPPDINTPGGLESSDRVSKEWDKWGQKEYNWFHARDMRTEHIKLENIARTVDHPTPEELLAQLGVDSSERSTSSDLWNARQVEWSPSEVLKL